MPDKETVERAQEDKREGKSPSTQAGEFVREEMHHVREGKHGARSTEQAVAIGLSKARRAGVKIPRKGKNISEAAHASAARGGASIRQAASPSARRSRAITKALKREGHSAASPASLGKFARTSARKRGHASLSAAARKASRTKGAAGRSAAARKAARTRARTS
jgi:uncharacterized protein DUF6496